MEHLCSIMKAVNVAVEADVYAQAKPYCGCLYDNTTLNFSNLCYKAEKMVKSREMQDVVQSC